MSQRPAAELIIEGRVATLSGQAGFGWAEAIALGEGLVIAAGRRAEVKALAGPRTRLWKLPPDSVVMPGITDAHLHLMLLVLAENQLDLSADSDLPGTLESIGAAHAERLAAGDRDGWLLGHGWSLDRLGQWPGSELLDAAAPGRPVALYAHDHHSRWVSGDALTRAGITAATPDPAGGMIRRTPDGRPSGMLHETASGLVDGVIPEPTHEQLETGLAGVAGKLAALGITGAHDPGELSGDRLISRGPTFYSRLAASGKLPLRVHASVRAAQLNRAIELGLRSGEGLPEAEAADGRSARRAARYRMGWLKLFSDGSLGSRSAAMLEPYSDAAVRAPTGGPRGMFLASAEELSDQLRRAAEAGIVGQVHAIGDAAVRRALDVLAALPEGRLMRRVEHAQLVQPEDQARFGTLRVAASVQPVHLCSDAGPAREAWAGRSRHAFPLAGLLAGGAVIPFGTDAPVEPVDPWPGIAVAVCRRDPLEPEAAQLGPEHAIPVARAVRAACLDPHMSAREERLGRLQEAYRADLIIVPAAGLRERPDPARLATTRPLATLIDGELVHRAAEFELD